MEKTYAQAILSLLSREGANEKQIMDNLFAHLKATGRTKLLPGISRELQKAQMYTKNEEAHVEVAHKDESHAALAEALALGIEAKHAEVNPSLISGWRARKGSTLIDRSGKRALVDLYRRITA
jgi:F0F1-type ATP synthase delta subunit